ncbi:MAG: DMT family transporter [Desulfovibrionaceae bacterium]|nr:DMT family transporter [Desulfovibrionaceae bacterium]
MFDSTSDSLPLAFGKLHLSVLLAGFTGIFGKLISLNEGLLVWYRLLITTLVFGIMLGLGGRMPKLSFRDALRMGGVGALLALHWVFFYGSIKASNVSVGVVSFSTVGFFTAVLEPLADGRRISPREIAFSLLTVAGVGLIFHFDTRYRAGISLGIVGAVLAALFTIANKRVARGHQAPAVLWYELIGGFLGLSCFLPFYLPALSVSFSLPEGRDFLCLFMLSLFCTIGLYILQIQALQSISAFTVNLTYNLEPVYSIVLAMLFFGEARQLNAAFYAGLGLIVLSVALQTLSAMRRNRAALRLPGAA